MNLSWYLILAVSVAVLLYGLYTVYNLSNALGDYLRS
jgi:hypothetical protein